MLTPFTMGPLRATLKARTLLDRQALERLRESGTLVLDDRRRRPLYFDGRFLAARDLTREQQYFLVRQADLARAAGTGVVAGLDVTTDAGGRTLRISAGHGVTPAGESVVLPEPLPLALGELPQTQMLDAAFGILRRPAEPPRNRTGLYLLVLRPVEFSANPVAAYPTSVTGARGVQDGDIVEGVAATLVPYPDPGGDAELGRRRARVARALFVERAADGIPVDALPLAMVALERNVVRWLDVAMVRREAGAEQSDRLGLGVAPRALREAHVLQYDAHLADVLRERGAGSRGARFAASEHFLALPPAGRLPAAAIDTATFTQGWFPPEVRVDLSIVPEDEIPALVEESLRLPPIDLALGGDALGSTSVLVLLAVPMARLRTLRATLERQVRPVPAAVPGLLAQRTPLAALRDLRLARLPAIVPPARTPADAAWAAEVAAAAGSGEGLLWYVRRRNVDYRSDVTGTVVRVAGGEADAERRVDENVRNLGLDARLGGLRERATTLAGAEVVTLLSARKFADSPLLTRAAVEELAAAAPQAVEGQPAPAVERTDVLKVSERFADPALGEGLARLAAESPAVLETPAVVNAIVDARLAPELDRAARTLPPEELAAFTKSVGDAAAAGNVAELRAVIGRAVAGGRIPR